MAKLLAEKVKYIIVHCSATADGKTFRAVDIDRWHRAQGWDGIGYHYVVDLDGKVEQGRPEDKIGAHCAGVNGMSLGVCYIGGLAKDGKTPKDTRTTQQKAALLALVKRLKKKYPRARVVGHHDFNKGKACPCFDAKKEYEKV